MDPLDVQIRSATLNLDAAVESFLASASLSDAAKFYSFAHELEDWAQVIAPTVAGEEKLLERASREGIASVLLVSQAQYRCAFFALRSTLEMVFQHLRLSMLPVDAFEWLEGKSMTSWAAITDSENGVLSPRTSLAFFAELAENIKHHRILLTTLYTELSEAVHCNTPKALPDLQFGVYDAVAVEAWSERAKTLVYLAIFGLSMRYLKSHGAKLGAGLTTQIEEAVGHITAIRVLIGGPM